MKRVIIFLFVLLLAQLTHLLATLWFIAAGIAGSSRTKAIALGYDQLANATTGGQPDETVSSRAERARLAGRRWGCVLCKFLDLIDPGHCERSVGR